MEIDAWLLAWIFIIIGAAVIEVATQNLVTIWFSGGGISALIAWLFGLPEVLQCALFVVVTGVLLLMTRPITARFKTASVPTNSDRVLGQDAVVLRDITEDGGLVKVLGQEWTAKTSDNTTFSKGEKVTVVAIEGVKVIVARKIL